MITLTVAEQSCERVSFLQLARNKQLDEFFVRDLNKDPSNWSMADCSFDAVLCCVSAQYLQQPEKVFAEIHRILKPGGVCIVTFSNRLYSTKGGFPSIHR